MHTLQRIYKNTFSYNCSIFTLYSWFHTGRLQKPLLRLDAGKLLGNSSLIIDNVFYLYWYHANMEFFPMLAKLLLVLLLEPGKYPLPVFPDDAVSGELCFFCASFGSTEAQLNFAVASVSSVSRVDEMFFLSFWRHFQYP